VHLFLSAPPSVAPAEIAHQLKGATARLVFQRFPAIKKPLWGGALWSRSSDGGSVGERSLDTVLKEIELGPEELIPLSDAGLIFLCLFGQGILARLLSYCGRVSQSICLSFLISKPAEKSFFPQTELLDNVLDTWCC
jgi:hypothetical protein